MGGALMNTLIVSLMEELHKFTSNVQCDDFKAVLMKEVLQVVVSRYTECILMYSSKIFMKDHKSRLNADVVALESFLQDEYPTCAAELIPFMDGIKVAHECLT